VVTARFQRKRRPHADRRVLNHGDRTRFAISVDRWVVCRAHAVSLSVAITSHVKVITSGVAGSWGKTELPSFSRVTAVGGPRERFPCRKKVWNTVGRFHVVSLDHKVVAASFKVESRANTDGNVFLNRDFATLVVSVDIRITSRANAVSLDITITRHGEQSTIISRISWCSKTKLPTFKAHTSIGCPSKFFSRT